MSNKEIEIKKIYVNSKEQFEKLYNSNALTLLGLDDTEKNLHSFAKWIKNLSEVSNPLNMYIIKGKQMNEQYGLSGKNKYQDEFRIVCVDLEDIKQVHKIIMPRFAINGRWFNDVVDNNVYRDGREGIKPKCALIGENGNIFNLMGIASRTLEKNNMKEKAKEMRDRITSSNSYDEALSIIEEYVEITDQSSLDEEEYE